jgi:hypothetical protein
MNRGSTNGGSTNGGSTDEARVAPLEMLVPSDASADQSLRLLFENDAGFRLENCDEVHGLDQLFILRLLIVSQRAEVGFLAQLLQLPNGLWIGRQFDDPLRDPCREAIGHRVKESVESRRGRCHAGIIALLPPPRQ